VLRKDLPPADDAAIYDEVAILSSLNHPHIIPLIDFFDEKDCYFIVMELMSGGDLFDRIGKKKSYSEADARDLVVKMLKAVAYCHGRKVAHCDMKPKNLLLMSDENDSYIKLADFGFAARVHEPRSLTKQCGTPFFVSPEILMRKGYDQQSDMWSVGCIVYLLLSGNLPFMGRSQKELFRKIVSGKYEFDEDEWEGVSDDAKDLVRRMLVLDPEKRITASAAVRHDWLKASRDRLGLISLQGTSQRLKTFNARMKLRSAMIAVDWVSSLKRMSSFSTRNLNPGNSGSESGNEKSGALMAAARRMKEYDDDQKDKERPTAASASASASAAKRSTSASSPPSKARSRSSSSEGTNGSSSRRQPPSPAKTKKGSSSREQPNTLMEF
jgi:serine/threonine protein kinase